MSSGCNSLSPVVKVEDSGGFAVCDVASEPPNELPAALSVERSVELSVELPLDFQWN